ncbi:MAG TPA: plastocyanin/azurin family copper-binding protein [Acidimicrobiia bacterium]|nr:plastocyanin/azurin family copper-binding protein [Acidimicrobiia bacterium]
MIRRLFATALFGALTLTACGGGGATTVTEGQDVTVRMFDNRYEYDEIHISPGGSVTFVGAGRNAHNAVAADGSWSSEDVFGSLEQFEGDEAVIHFDQPGEYPFFCTFHGNAEGDAMAGTVIVEVPEG